jgi:hypothetical protein
MCQQAQIIEVLDGAERAAVTERAAFAAVERLQGAVVGFGRGDRGVFERDVEVLRALAGAAGAAFAGRLVVAGSLSGPAGEVPGGRELGHVGADLGDQDLSGLLSDARDRCQQVPGGAKGAI